MNTFLLCCQDVPINPAKHQAIAAALLTICVSLSSIEMHKTVCWNARFRSFCSRSRYSDSDQTSTKLFMRP